MRTALALTDLLDKSETWSFRVPLDRIADALSLLTSFKGQPFRRWVWSNGKPLEIQHEARVQAYLQDPTGMYAEWIENISTRHGGRPHLLIIFDNPDDAMMFKLRYIP